MCDYAEALIASGENVGYVVDELKSMEMEVCDENGAHTVGRTRRENSSSNDIVSITRSFVPINILI